MTKVEAPKRLLTKKEQGQLLNQIDIETLIGLRNYLIILLILKTGFKLSEVCDFKWNEVDLINQEVEDKNNSRTIYIPDELNKALIDWGKKQEKYLNAKPDYVFTSLRKGARGNQISKRYIQDMINRYTDEAGIDKNVSPKILRYSYAYNIYKELDNLLDIKEALGNISLDTLMKYI